jgi:hypothetical protein
MHGGIDHRQFTGLLLIRNLQPLYRVIKLQAHSQTAVNSASKNENELTVFCS